MNKDSGGSLELQDIQVIKLPKRFCVREVEKFEKNSHRTHIVHAVLHFAEFAVISSIKLFFHIHQWINKKLVQEDPKRPKLHEEKHLVFFVIPLCMVMSFLLAIMWIAVKKFDKKETLSFLGSGIGAGLMLLNSVSVMRQPEIYINLEDVSNEELIRHPVFIHNFVICILSIFALAMYLIHFWALFECWLWRRKQRLSEVSTSNSRSDVSDSDTSGSDRKTIKKEHSDESAAVSGSNDPRRSTNPDDHDIEKLPVILYCCCMDTYSWIKYKLKKNHQHDCCHTA